MKAIFVRELKAQFSSITGYIVSACLLLLTGLLTVFICMHQYSARYEGVLVYITLLMLILIPILTMRVFAEEKKQRTDQLLYALPLSMTKIVLGKFFALFVTFFIPMILVGIYPLIINIYGAVDFNVVYCTYFGIMLFGGALIAVCMFISSLTESVLIAALVSAIILILNAVLSLFAGYLPFGSAFFEYVGLPTRLDNFSAGIFDISAVIFYITIIALFIFLTVQSLEKRRWS